MSNTTYIITMTRSLSRTCYKIIEKLSILCILISCISAFTTVIISGLLEEPQLIILNNVLSTLTNIGFYGAIALTSFMVGAKRNQYNREITEQAHAEILQAATRRRLSQKQDKSVWKTAEIPPWTPPMRTRSRGRTARLEFDDNSDDSEQQPNATDLTYNPDKRFSNHQAETIMRVDSALKYRKENPKTDNNTDNKIQ
jgi:hypothetical protein